MKRVLVCFSGGLDSAVVLSATAEQAKCEALLFDYGQPHSLELSYARKEAERLGVPHRTVSLPALPQSDDVVFVGRNLLFAAHAIAIAAAEGFDAVALGCNFSDWDRFPDCRPVFWKSVNAAAETYGVQVLLPLLNMTKAQVVSEARARRIDIARTWSCYSPNDGEPCGSCLACQTRAEAGA